MGPREPDLPGQIKSFLESWSISVCSNEAQIGKTKVRTYTLLHETFLHRTVSCTYVPCHSCPYPSLHIILCYVRTYVRTYGCHHPLPCSIKTFLHLCCLATAPLALAFISYGAIQTYVHTNVHTDVISLTLFNHTPSIFCLLSQSSFH